MKPGMRNRKVSCCIQNTWCVNWWHRVLQVLNKVRKTPGCITKWCCSNLFSRWLSLSAIHRKYSVSKFWCTSEHVGRPCISASIVGWNCRMQPIVQQTPMLVRYWVTEVVAFFSILGYLSESLDKSHSKVTVSEATPSGSAQPTISSKEPELAAISTIMPDFPLIPASRGFCLTLVGLLENFLKTLETIASE